MEKNKSLKKFIYLKNLKCGNGFLNNNERFRRTDKKIDSNDIAKTDKENYITLSDINLGSGLIKDMSKTQIEKI